MGNARAARGYGGGVLRDSLRSSLGLGSLRNSLEGLDTMAGGDRDRDNRGGMGASVDTLGSSGIKALMMPDFRLDGSKKEGEAGAGGDDFSTFMKKYNIDDTNGNGMDVNTSANSATSGASNASDTTKDMTRPQNKDLMQVNANMDTLLKRLHDDETFEYSYAGAGGSGSRGGNGGVTANSINQVAEMLQAEMKGFMNVVEERTGQREGTTKVQLEREEQLREEGRAEARAKGLFGLGFLQNPSSAKSDTPTPFDAEIEAHQQKQNAQVSVREQISSLDAVLGAELDAPYAPSVGTAGTVHADAVTASALPPPPMSVPQNLRDSLTSHTFEGMMRQQSSSSSPSTPAARGNGSGLPGPVSDNTEFVPLQQAVDNEMGAADEILFRMRALRTGLGTRLRKLDALHASVMSNSTDQSQANQSAVPQQPVSARYVYGPGGGGIVVPPQMERMIQAQQAQQQRQTQVAGGDSVSVARSMTNLDVNGREVPSYASASHAPPLPDHHIAVHLDTNTADAVAGAAKEIHCRLDVQMEGLLNRLSDNHKAAEATATRVVPSSVLLPKSPPQGQEQAHKETQSMSVQNTSAGTQATQAQATQATQAQVVQTSTSSGSGSSTTQESPSSSPAAQAQDCGPTVAQLRAPPSPKTLQAQLDEMDAVLGAEAGPGAPVGLDRFLPPSVREGSTLSPSPPSSAAATPARSAMPSPFKQSHQSPTTGPMLYTVPSGARNAAPGAVPSSATAGQFFSHPHSQNQNRGPTPLIRVYAPSDHELWLQEQAIPHAPASAPTAPTTNPSLPAQHTNSNNNTSGIQMSPPEQHHHHQGPMRAVDVGNNGRSRRPWAEEGGFQTGMQYRPVEGTAMLYGRGIKAQQKQDQQEELQKQRLHQQQQLQQQQQQQQSFNYDMFSQNAGRHLHNQSHSQSSGAQPVSDTALSVDLRDRQAYLKKMQKLREGVTGVGIASF